MPLEVEFNGRDSSDPDGDALAYKWTFDNGTTSTSSHPTRTFTEKRKYRVTLTVSDGKGGTDTDTVTIDAGNTRPEAIITSPVADSEYSVGQTITLKGYGDDAEDGIIPTSRRTWEVILHHDTHTHPFLGPTTGNNLTFQAPQPEDLQAASNSYLEIKLTVRDSDGLGKTRSINIYPNKVNITVGSNIPGMLVWVEGQPFTAPTTILTWENNPLSILAPDQIGPDDQPYVYQSWSDGGRRSHNYDPPASDATVTATFNILAGTSFPAHADARVSEANPTRNEGTGTGLSVKGGSTSDYETVIRFKLSGVGDTVYRARLYLYSYDGTSNGPGIYEASPSWSESTVTWNNRPAALGGLIDDYGPIAKRSWIAYDVTGTIDGDGYVAFVITGSSSDAVTWYSRQSGSYQPRLVVWSSAPAMSEDPVSETPAVDASPEPVPTETATPESTLPVATDVPPTATETPTMEVPSPTMEPASPVPFRDSFDADLAQWATDGAALAPGMGSDGSQALSLVSGGTDEISGSPAYVQYGLGTGETDLYVNLVTRASGVGPNGARIVSITGNDSSVVASIYVLSDGSLALRWTDQNELVNLGLASQDQWVTIEIRMQVSGGTASATVWLNGEFASSTTQSITSSELGTVILGGWATDRSYNLLVDDVRIDRTCTGSCPDAAVTEPTAEATWVDPGQSATDPGTPESE